MQRFDIGLRRTFSEGSEFARHDKFFPCEKTALLLERKSSDGAIPENLLRKRASSKFSAHRLREKMNRALIPFAEKEATSPEQLSAKYRRGAAIFGVIGIAAPKPDGRPEHQNKERQNSNAKI